MTDHAEVRLKVCMAGEGAVGKSSLIRRYVLDEFDDRYVATLGTKITKRTLLIPDPKGHAKVTVHVMLWDIMGTPVLRELLKEAYYHGAQGILAVADQTRKATLPALDEWSGSIRSVAGDVPTFGIVNKRDLPPDKAFGEGEIEAFFGQRAWAWSYASAKTGAGVEESFRRLAELVLRSRSGT